MIFVYSFRLVYQFCDYLTQNRKPNNIQKTSCRKVTSLRSWQYCKRTGNKVLAAEPTSEQQSCEENEERDFEIPPARKKNHQMVRTPVCGKTDWLRAVHTSIKC